MVGADGRLSWIVDAFTSSATYPYSAPVNLENQQVNYIRNSVKAVVDAYDGTVTFYVFDNDDPILAAWRGIFPGLFKDASTMPAWLRAHVRYPETLLSIQADMYGLYHMTDPEVFYNREDQWSVATQTGSNQGDQSTQEMHPNFVLMTLPGESGGLEFVEILPFTPVNRNNLIGWIAARSDGANYGKAVVFDFPKTRLVDGPQQIEARIDQNAQLSGQLTLWNQQGSHVIRGNLLVIPCGQALLICGADLLAGAAEPHAGVAAGGAGAAGSAGLRPELRSGAWLALRIRSAVALGAGRRRRPRRGQEMGLARRCLEAQPSRQ